MDWSAFWTSLITSIGGTTVLVVLLAWLGKSWIGTRIEKSVGHEYDKKLEDHKAQLQQQNAEAVQKMQDRVQAVLDEKAVDKVLFEKFLATLPSQGGISFIKDFNMAGFSFQQKKLEHLKEFDWCWGDAEHEFLDPALEGMRKKLHDLVGEYLGFISVNTFPLDKDVSCSWVPPDWEETQREHFWEVVNRLHDMAGEIVELHSDLVRTARNELKL